MGFFDFLFPHKNKEADLEERRRERQEEDKKQEEKRRKALEEEGVLLSSLTEEEEEPDPSRRPRRCHPQPNPRLYPSLSGSGWRYQPDSL